MPLLSPTTSWERYETIVGLPCVSFSLALTISSAFLGVRVQTRGSKGSSAVKSSVSALKGLCSGPSTPDNCKGYVSMALNMQHNNIFWCGGTVAMLVWMAMMAVESRVESGRQGEVSYLVRTLRCDEKVLAWPSLHVRHGSLEPPIGQGLICSQETKCTAVFYDVYRF